MKLAIRAFLSILIFGYLGAFLTPFLGIILSIAIMGAFIVYAIEKKHIK